MPGMNGVLAKSGMPGMPGMTVITVMIDMPGGLV